jgi:hypothetical protein
MMPEEAALQNLAPEPPNLLLVPQLEALLNLRWSGYRWL